MEENKEDYMSALPDEILRHIIPFLPFESALQTILISRKWRCLWQSLERNILVRNGDIGSVADEIECFFNRFDELDFLKNPRKLQFQSSHGATILFATIAANKKLHLDFSIGEQESPPSQFPWFLGINRRNHFTRHPSTCSPIFIKSLHLTSVNSLISAEISTLLENIQLLETLKIKNCNGLQSLSIQGGQELRILTVLDCPQLKSLDISQCSLESFRYRGQAPVIQLEKFLSLEDVMLDFREGQAHSECKRAEDYYSLVLAISDVPILTLCKWFFQAYIFPRLSVNRGELRFYCLRELWWIESLSIEKEEDNNFDALLSLLKLCPLLEKLFISIDPTSYCRPSTGKNTNEFDARIRLGHLKLIKFEGFASEEDEILLAERLLEIVMTKPLIISTANKNCVKSLVRRVAQPEQHDNKEVVSLLHKGRKYSYKLVEVVDIDEHHAHMSVSILNFSNGT